MEDDKVMSLFTPLRLLVEEEWFTRRIGAALISNEVLLLGDLVTVEERELKRTPYIGKKSFDLIKFFIENVTGYHLGYIIPEDDLWWKYRILLRYAESEILRECVSDTLLAWLRDDNRYTYVYQLITEPIAEIQEYFSPKGISVSKIEESLGRRKLKFGMDLPNEVEFALKYLFH